MWYSKVILIRMSLVFRGYLRSQSKFYIELSNWFGKSAAWYFDNQNTDYWSQDVCIHFTLASFTVIGMYIGYACAIIWVNLECINALMIGSIGATVVAMSISYIWLYLQEISEYIMINYSMCNNNLYNKFELNFSCSYLYQIVYSTT